VGGGKESSGRRERKDRRVGDVLLVIVSMAALFVEVAETWWCCPV